MAQCPYEYLDSLGSAGSIRLQDVEKYPHILIYLEYQNESERWNVKGSVEFCVTVSKNL